jgi:hypothetical protein
MDNELDEVQDREESDLFRRTWFSIIKALPFLAVLATIAISAAGLLYYGR